MVKGAIPFPLRRDVMLCKMLCFASALFISSYWGGRYIAKKKMSSEEDISKSDSGAVRTRDPQLRRLLLYPTELRNHPL